MSAIGLKQTWAIASHMSAFGGKADMTVCGNPLSRSLLGVKRTSSSARHMSAFDPKRTWRLRIVAVQLTPDPIPSITNPCCNRVTPKHFPHRPRALGAAMRRRTFIEGIAVLAAAWPLAARAQQPVERMRLIGMLLLYKADSQEGQDCVRAFQQTLQKLGWNDGRNVRTEIRWGENNVDLERQYATELVALMPDVILAAGGLSAVSLQHIRQIPIVFV